MLDQKPNKTQDQHTDLLRQFHLRPTRQRLALADLLFSGPCRHVSAEQLRLKLKTKASLCLWPITTH